MASEPQTSGKDLAKRRIKGAAETVEAGNLWLNNGSCVRLRPEHKDHVWSYDFVTDHTEDSKTFGILNIIDEYTRECLTTLVERKIKADDVIDQLFNLFVFRGIPDHIRSDDGPEFTAGAVRKWLNRLGVKALFIEPGSPWRTGISDHLTGICETNC